MKNIADTVSDRNSHSLVTANNSGRFINVSGEVKINGSTIIQTSRVVVAVKTIGCSFVLVYDKLLSFVLVDPVPYIANFKLIGVLIGDKS